MILDDKVKKILEEKLFLSVFLKPEEMEYFYKVINHYLLNRSSLEAFSKNLDETIEFYNFLGIEQRDMLSSIAKWPSIIHADKNELFKKYLVLEPVVKFRTGEKDREHILIDHPLDLMTGLDTIFARVMFFKDENNTDKIREERITRRKLLKTTSTEFEESYGLNKIQLLEKYPLTPEMMEEVLTWGNNKELMERYENQNERRRHA